MGFNIGTLLGGGAGFLVGGPMGAMVGAGLGSSLTKEGISGSSGGFETSTTPRWNAQQQALFQQLYGSISPNVGKGMTPTKEEGQYSDFLSNYEPWYRGVVDEAYNPKAVSDYYKNAIIPEIETSVAPKVASQYGGPGYWGSARARAVSDLYAGVGRQEATDIYGVEKAKSTAIADLANRLPVAKETAAKWSRSFTPEMAPYFNQALALLGLQPFDTLAAYKQGSPGLLGSIMPAAGAAIGTNLGKNASGYLGQLSTALGLG